ncbi:MAG: hypothetical protein EZS28_013415 [Streblomastix strix]|uniref:Uncharacterized protein n=1 Tax=Streblomastix strix TaxID=222440 RepID=A0A5J4W847_9EUKA|nr:MAG: hypothetical protein EZS28_013415 [Streblomastix strix]
MSNVYIDEALLDAAGLSEFPELYAYIHEREPKPIVDGIANQIIIGPQYLQDQVKDNDDKLNVQPIPQPFVPIDVPQTSFISFAGMIQINGNDTPDVVVNQGSGFYPMDQFDFSGSYLIVSLPQESNQNTITSNGPPISHIDSVIMQHDTLPSVPIPPSVFPYYIVTEVSRDQLLALTYSSYDLDAYKIYIIDDTVQKLVMFNMHLRQKWFIETKQLVLSINESIDPKKTLQFPVMILQDFKTEPLQDIPSAYLIVADTDNAARSLSDTDHDVTQIQISFLSIILTANVQFDNKFEGFEEFYKDGTVLFIGLKSASQVIREYTIYHRGRTIDGTWQNDSTTEQFIHNTVKPRNYQFRQKISLYLVVNPIMSMAKYYTMNKTDLMASGPDKLKNIDLLFRNWSLKYQYTKQFTQIGCTADLITKISIEQITDSGLKNLMCIISPVTLSIKNYVVTEVTANMGVCKETDDSLQGVREFYANRPFVVPSQSVEAWSFPTSATTTGIRTSQNIPLSHVTDLCLLFPKELKQQLVMKIHAIIICNKLDQSFEATDEFEDTLTTPRNTASRRLNPHTDLTSFMITQQCERNSNGALIFNGLETNNQNVSIELRGASIYQGDTDCYYNVDNFPEFVVHDHNGFIRSADGLKITVTFKRQRVIKYFTENPSRKDRATTRYKQWKEEDKPADRYRHFIKHYISPFLKERGYTVAQVYSVIGGRILKGVIAPWPLQYYDKSYQAQSFIEGGDTSIAIYKKLSKAIKYAYNQCFITGNSQQRDNQMMRLIQVGYAAFWNRQLGEIPDSTNDDGEEIFIIPTEKAIKEVKQKRDEKRLREQRSYESDIAKIKARKKPTFSEGKTLENARLSSYYFQNDLDDYGVLREEKAGVVGRAAESACAVNEGIAGLFHDVARGREENVVSMISKLYEASLVNIGDSQRERKSRLRGVMNGLQTEDVLSKSSREKFKARKPGRTVLPRFNGQGYSFSSNYRNSFFAKKGMFDQSRQNQFKDKGNYSIKKRLFTPILGGQSNKINIKLGNIRTSRLNQTFYNDSTEIVLTFNNPRISKIKAIDGICNRQVAQQSQRYSFKSLEDTLAYFHGSCGEDGLRKRSEYFVEYGQMPSRFESEFKQSNDRDQGSLKDIQYEQDVDGSGIHRTDLGSELRQPSQLEQGSSKMGNVSNGINDSQQSQSKQYIDRQIGKLMLIQSSGNLDIARYCATQSVPQQFRQLSNLDDDQKSRIQSRLADIQPVAFVVVRVSGWKPPSPFPRRMEEDQNRRIDRKGDQSILDTPGMSPNLIRKQISPSITEIYREYDSTGGVDTERVERIDNRGNEEEGYNMDQPLFRNSQE